MLKYSFPERTPCLPLHDIFNQKEMQDTLFYSFYKAYVSFFIKYISHISCILLTLLFLHISFVHTLKAVQFHTDNCTSTLFGILIPSSYMEKWFTLRSNLHH